MKLKTLLTVLAMLCISLFVVACGGGDDTTADPGTQAPGATTTKATTTKKTTTKKTTTTKVTTTTVTTTLAPDYMSKLPAALPENTPFQIHTRIGLDDENDYLGFKGNYDNGVIVSDGAVYGKAWSFEVAAGRLEMTGTAPRCEVYVSLGEAVDVEGMKGVLWYVDFSKVDGQEGKLCTSITLGDNTYRSKGDSGGPTQGQGYYYANGEWVATSAINACRMGVPVGFKGWVYVPVTSYQGAGTLYDATNGTCLANFINLVRLYTDGYTYETGKAIIFDEIIFVK